LETEGAEVHEAGGGVTAVQEPVTDQEPELQEARRVPVYPLLQTGTQVPPDTVVVPQFPEPALETEGAEVHEGAGGGGITTVPSLQPGGRGPATAGCAGVTTASGALTGMAGHTGILASLPQRGLQASFTVTITFHWLLAVVIKFTPPREK